MFRMTVVVAVLLFALPALAKSQCMFNPKDGKYHKCHHASFGQCHHYGLTCEPEGKCMFNPKDGKYHKCHHASFGQCHHYGLTCEP